MVLGLIFLAITGSVTFLKTIQPYAVGIIFVLIYIVEHIIPQRRDLVDYRHDFINIAIGLFNLVIAALGGYFLQKCLDTGYKHNFGLLYNLPFWMQVISGFIISDLFMYWWHRANHSVSFLWYFHRFHHTDVKLNASSAVRFHTIELILSYVLKIPIFLLIGISSSTVIIYGLVFIPVVTLHHSNIRIGKKTDWLIRLLFVSPRMHRIHHSIICKETNSNYSSVFPYWDKLFKSYRALPEKEVEFGIT